MSLREEIAHRTIEVDEDYLKAKVNTALRSAIAQFKRRMRMWIEGNADIPVATGYLKESGIDVLYESRVEGTSFSAYFGFAAEYAKYIDEGRTPAFPPVDAIKAWCNSVGIPEEAAWPIAMNLAKHGTPGKHFFESGVVEAKRVLQEELIRAFSMQGIDALVQIL